MNGLLRAYLTLGQVRVSAHVKSTHARDFIDRFSHFLASFNNRQGRGSEFQKNFKVGRRGGSIREAWWLN